MAKMGRPRKKNGLLQANKNIRFDAETEKALRALEKAAAAESNGGQKLSQSDLVRQAVMLCYDLLRKKKIKPKELLPS